MFDLKIVSPVEQLHHPLFEEKKVSVFIKRDDQIHPYISGNKWRKLKYLLFEAQSGDKNHLVTFGGAWSNHLLATACAAAKFGFKCTGIVRGESVSNPLLTLCAVFGMNLIFAERERYRDKKNLFKQYFGSDREAFFIDEGGASAAAVKGCAELISELEEEYDHLFCACGTGTTLAGLIKGLAEFGKTTVPHGVPVLKSAGFLKDDINSYLSAGSGYVFHEDYHFGGYAKVNKELIAFIKTFSAATGILVDPVYTGKLLFAIFDLIKTDYFKPGSRILAIHTGGLFGLLGMMDSFQE